MGKWIILLMFIMYLCYEFVKEWKGNKNISKIILKGCTIPTFCYLILN